MTAQKMGRIIIPSGRRVWPHEMHVAKILAAAGHEVEFLPEVGPSPADIRLDGKIIYEIKSPFTNKDDKLERNIKRGLKQSKNIIFDSHRIKNMKDEKLLVFLRNKVKEQKQLNKLLLIDKKDRIIDIK